VRFVGDESQCGEMKRNSSHFPRWILKKTGSADVVRHLGHFRGLWLLQTETGAWDISVSKEMTKKMWKQVVGTVYISRCARLT